MHHSEYYAILALAWLRALHNTCSGDGCKLGHYIYIPSKHARKAGPKPGETQLDQMHVLQICGLQILGLFLALVLFLSLEYEQAWPFRTCDCSMCLWGPLSARCVWSLAVTPSNLEGICSRSVMAPRLGNYVRMRML